jgi:hypothetical protein
MSIVSEIKKNQAKAFRRIYMRRRTASDYETDWQLIPSKYIRNYGSVDIGVEGIKVNFFKFGGYNFKVDNVDGYFSDVDDDRSFFYGYACVPRTMVKVEAGYLASDGTEYPTNPTLFIGLLGGNLDFDSNNLMDFQCDHLSKVFEEFNANAIVNMNGNYTAGEIFEKIRDYQDGNLVYVFQKYISSGAWTIETTTTQYNMATNTTLEGISCWELMTKLAEAETKNINIDRTGTFLFQAREALQSTPVFHFSGLGDNDRTYGHNVMENITNSKKYSKVYNRIRVKHDKEDTITSYYTKSETWNWADSTSSFLYGVKTYNVENEFLATVTAQTIAENIYNEYVNPKYEVRLQTKFVPQLDIGDRVSLTYRTKILSGGVLWGYFLWGHGLFGSRVGYNINIENKEYKLIQMKHDIEKFYSIVDMREI